MDSGFPVVIQFKAINRQFLGGYNYVLRNPDFTRELLMGTSVLSTMGVF
jgi:hypothetical protein